MKALPFILLAFAPLGKPWAQDIRNERHVATTPAVEQAALRYTARFAKELGFERWVIVVAWDTLPPDIIARTFPRPEYQAGVILLDAEYFVTKPAGDLCETIVHELWHLRLSLLRQALLSLSPDTSVARQAVALEESVVSDLSRLALWRCR